jgi:CMP/dCMP kinase
MHQAPVITIDGPSACGKGTISQMLAKELGWHFLDSGAIYRAMAWGVLEHKIDLDDIDALMDFLTRLNIELKASRLGDSPQVWCDNKDITVAIRLEECGKMASRLGAIPQVRAHILQRQRDQREKPGLVADGRDMGTVVFPDAQLKFYFTAATRERAKRRFTQLQEKGINGSLRDIEQEMRERDDRDEHREVAPAKPAPDSIMIDTTAMDIPAVFSQVLEIVKEYF